DGLVNAAGIAVGGSVDQLTLATWRRAIDVNVLGPFLGIKAAWAMLGVGGGSVVNLSPASGLIGAPDRTADNATPRAIRQLTRAAALDGARQANRIRVNAVHAAWEEATTSCHSPAADVPLGRFARPEQVAACVVYLLSDESAFVTGASYVLDGG